jgi:hypothetical protein
LATVDVENPHGDAVFTGNTRKEIGKRLGVIIVFNDELVLAV